MKFSFWSEFSRIRLTQVGEPLGHGEQGFFHCTSADRVVGAASSSVSEPTDEQEPQFTFGVADLTEGRGDTLRLAEVVPCAEG